jgi:hypothetical protein
MEWIEVQCSQLFHECHAGKPQTAIDGEPPRWAVWAARLCTTSCFSFSTVSGFGVHCLLSRPLPSRLRPFKITSCSNSPWVGRIPLRVSLSAIPAVGAVLSEDVYVGHYSRLSDCSITLLCQRVEVATARVQHTRAYQVINGIEHAQPFFRLVARCLEEYVQVQAMLPHCPE